MTVADVAIPDNRPIERVRHHAIVTGVAYPPLNRDEARRDPSAIDVWRERVHAEQARRLARAGPVDPGAPSRPGVFDPVVEFNRRMVDDLEWADGYMAGRRDAEARRAGAAEAGPGPTPDPKDGWSTGPTRAAAYALGLQDG